MGSDLVKWDDPNAEPPVHDEEGLINQTCNLINKVQEHNFSHHRHGFRGTHVKTQAIVKGSLTVQQDLPPHLAQGIFSEPGRTYPIAIRYANEPSFLQDDRKPGPRGCGMKVFNVDGPGPFLDHIGEQTHTQDFTFNNAPILELTDLPTTVDIFSLRENGVTLDLQLAPYGLPNHHFMAYTMYSQAAYRYGDYIVKYGLFPTGEFQQKLAESDVVSDDSNREQHSVWLRDYFQNHDAEFDFQVQLCRDLSEQPVEDASQEWQPDFETVAKLTLHKGQDVFDARRQSFWDDSMKLNTWYGLEAHRPLGSANRLRKCLYQSSVKKRETINNNETVLVKDINQIP